MTRSGRNDIDSFRQPYNGDGRGGRDCSGDATKRMKQYSSGMSIREIEKSMAQDLSHVIERVT